MSIIKSQDIKTGKSNVSETEFDVKPVEMPERLMLAMKLVDIETSDAFKEASTIVKNHSQVLLRLKEVMKKDKITKVTWKRLTNRYVVDFKIREQMRVDLALLPTDIKDKFQKSVEVWVKQVSVIGDEELVNTWEF